MSEEDALAALRGMPRWSADVEARLTKFIALLEDENSRQNLVSKQSLGEVWSRHILDSAQLIGHVPRGTRTWLDLGTGAGLPGIVVACLLSDVRVALVESRARRIDWLNIVHDALLLTNSVVLGERLELVRPQQFDVISARAFAPLPRLLEMSARFSTEDTVWVLPKGRSAQQELQELRGWRHTFHVEQSLSDAQSGIIVGHLLGRKGTKP